MSNTQAPLRQAPPAHLPYLGLLFVVLAWGSGPVITKLVTTPPMVGALVRFGITVPVLFALVGLTGGHVSKAILWRAAPPGLAFGINLIFVFNAVQEATVAVLAVVTTLQPALILLISGPLFGERPTATHVAWTVVGVGGAAAVVLGAGGDLQASPAGVLYAVAALGTFTMYFLLTRLARTATTVKPIEWMAAINFWSFLAVLPPALLTLERSDFDTLDGTDWLWLVILAYFTGVSGHVVMSWVHGYVPASRSSLGLLCMNVFAVLLAWPVHDEPMTWIQGIGGLVVLTSVAAVLRIPVAAVKPPPTASR